MTQLRIARQFLSGSADASGKPPYLLSLRSSTALIVVAVNLAIFTDVFFYGLITPVLPFALSTQVGVSEDEVQFWLSVLLAAYSAAFFVGSPIAGAYADHTSSRRWPLLLGLLALAGSTLLLALSHSLGLFVLGRVLQGLSASVVWSVGCALLVDTMGNAVGVAMGYVNISAEEDTGADTHDDHESISEMNHGVKRARPIITLLKSKRLLTALYGIFVQSGLLMGFDAVVALFVKGLFEWNSTAVGLIYLAFFLPGFAAPLAGLVSDRWGAKWPSLAGLTGTIPALISLRFVTENTIQQKALLVILFAIIGFSLSMSLTTLMAEISYVIESRETENPGVFGENGVYGLAYGLHNMAYALGGVVGPIWAGYVVRNVGWGTLGWTFSLLYSGLPQLLLRFYFGEPISQAHP
ncbi:major facilitator superfamily domain-containing protein [Xylaria sp. CBS 124048]|nr:major facilitator superfamily domain-containing protein [Xylaria sp. CBS 124048]